jgi:hypothetical protein
MRRTSRKEHDPGSMVRQYLMLQEGVVLTDGVWLIYAGHIHYLTGP